MNLRNPGKASGPSFTPPHLLWPRVPCGSSWTRSPSSPMVGSLSSTRTPTSCPGAAQRPHHPSDLDQVILTISQPPPSIGGGMGLVDGSLGTYHLPPGSGSGSVASHGDALRTDSRPLCCCEANLGPWSSTPPGGGSSQDPPLLGGRYPRALLAPEIFSRMSKISFF